jgi:N-acetylmuramoyl-L-alanine amidase
MKKLLFLAAFCLTFALDASSINKLEWIEIAKERFAPQIMLDFSEPLYFEKKIDAQKLCLELAFPGMSSKDFLKHDVITKLKEMKGIIRDVEIYDKKVPSPRAVLSITFSKKDILIRWSKMEDPNRLIFDIFSKKSLDKLKNNGSMLLYAKNDVVKSDVESSYAKIPSSFIKLGSPNLKHRNKNVQIVVDAGHGGQDSGASGFFLLKEKDIALDVARRTANLLKKNGFKVFLTRNCDKDLTLLERTELAGQLKADLFLSIHVNAIAGMQNIAGIETYCLKGDNILPPERMGGFLFVSGKKDLELSKTADNLLKSNVDLSKKLASCVQGSIMDFLKEKKLSSIDRGVKAAQFRILLRSEIPVTLIELGFLTNKQEAKKLANSAYHQILAEGIARGVKEYLDSH